MIKQPHFHIDTPISERLANFLRIQFSIPFQEHNPDSFAKRQYTRDIETQKEWRKFVGSPFIYTSTALCQPFLFWNGIEIDIGGVSNYNYRTKTGTFIWNAACWNLELSAVHSYYVYAKTNHNCFLCLNPKILPELAELEDIYVAASIKSKTGFDLVIYHRNELIYQKNNIYPELSVPFEDMQVNKTFARYVRYSSCDNNDVYKNFMYSFDDLKEYQLDDSEKMPSVFYKYEATRLDWTRFKRNVRPSSDRICIFLHLTNSTVSQIVKEFIQKADLVETLPNVFADDPSVNLKVTYINRPEDVRFIYYCMSEEPILFGVSVFGIPVDQLEEGTLNNEHEQRYFLQGNATDVVYLKRLVRNLFEKCNEPQRVNMLPKQIYMNCISGKDMEVYVYQYLRDSFSGLYSVPEFWNRKRKDFEIERKKYKEILHVLTLEGKYSAKWISEYSLYQLVQNEYPDAIYQYHPDWLGLQSLDIFIPSIQTGIEYQGQQHYYAVDIFGGEKGLAAARARDERKRTLCREMGVRLIEWKYNEPITNLILSEKLGAQ